MMLKELAEAIEDLSYTEMMAFCESEAFTGYGNTNERAKAMSSWAKKTLYGTNKEEDK